MTNIGHEEGLLAAGRSGGGVVGASGVRSSGSAVLSPLRHGRRGRDIEVALFSAEGSPGAVAGVRELPEAELQDSRVGLAGARLSARGVAVLGVIAVEPGLSNREVGERAGIFNQGHAGEVIRRLRRLGLVVNAQAGRRPQANAWRLTSAGERLALDIGRDTAPVAEPAGVRLSRRSVSILRVIGGQPGLSNKEVGERLGVLHPAQIAELLRRLRESGLIVNSQPGRNPKANAWHLTSAGKQLDTAMRREPGAVGDGRALHSSSAARQRALGSSVPAGGVDPRRRRVVAAVARIASVEGPGALSVERIAGVARVSAEGLDDRLRDPAGALLVAFEDALVWVGERVGVACAGGCGWLERVRLGLLGLLEFFDEQPELARLLVVHSAKGGPALDRRRAEVLTWLARLLDGQPAVTRAYPPVLSARAVVSGVLGVLQEQLCCPEPVVFVELSQSLMSFIVMPFLGAAAARRELSRPAVLAPTLAARKAAQELLHGFSGRAMRYPLAPRVLHVIRGQAGLSNAQVAELAGVIDNGQVSRMLARLGRLGLIESSGETAHLPGRPNAWRLTSSGEQVESALRYGASLTEADANGAVSLTAAGFALVGGCAGNKNGRGRWRAGWPLVGLSALSLPLLHCVCRVIYRLLRIAVAPVSSWLNKRCRSTYSISRIGRKPEPSCQENQALWHGLTRAHPDIYKHRRRSREPCPQPGAAAPRGRLAHRSEVRRDRALAPWDRYCRAGSALDNPRLRKFLLSCLPVGGHRR